MQFPIDLALQINWTFVWYGWNICDMPASRGPFPSIGETVTRTRAGTRTCTCLLAGPTSPLWWGQKRTTLTQELIRRLLNCRKELSCKLKQKHLNRYMQMLKNSGYEAKFRAEVLRAGRAGYRKISAADKAGQRPLYRHKQWQAAARRLEKWEKLARSLLEIMYFCASNTRVKAQKTNAKLRTRAESWRERGMAHQNYCRQNFGANNQCRDEKCAVNNNSDSKINCRRNVIKWLVWSLCKLERKMT